MAKKKTHSEVEYLRGLVRELKSKNRQLLKRLRHYEKREHFFEEFEEEEEIINNIYNCPNCRKYNLYILDLNIKKFEICKLCGYKKKIYG